MAKRSLVRFNPLFLLLFLGLPLLVWVVYQQTSVQSKAATEAGIETWVEYQNSKQIFLDQEGTTLYTRSCPIVTKERRVYVGPTWGGCEDFQTVGFRDAIPNLSGVDYDALRIAQIGAYTVFEDGIEPDTGHKRQYYNRFILEKPRFGTYGNVQRLWHSSYPIDYATGPEWGRGPAPSVDKNFYLWRVNKGFLNNQVDSLSAYVYSNGEQQIVKQLMMGRNQNFESIVYTRKCTVDNSSQLSSGVCTRWVSLPQEELKKWRQQTGMVLYNSFGAYEYRDALGQHTKQVVSNDLPGFDPGKTKYTRTCDIAASDRYDQDFSKIGWTVRDVDVRCGEWAPFTYGSKDTRVFGWEAYTFVSSLSYKVSEQSTVNP